jgi:hypothetical protein
VKVRMNSGLAALVLAAAVLAAPAARAADHCCGGYCDTCPCGGATPCICCDYNGENSGNCVWWAWHEACCHWGDSLAWCGNANTWDDSARAHGYTTLRSPCESTVFVMHIGTYGHVGWVVNVHPDGSFDTTEMSCFTYYGMRRYTRSAGSADYFILRYGQTSCGPSCECTPGETGRGACGNCGTRTRTCGDDCQWDAWSACTGEGECSAGSTQVRDCCDCGTESRTCSSDCAWGDWGACSGPDPDGGNQECDTGECGPCADGRMRCVEGCLACVPEVEATGEICDDVDNDCNCSVDDGYPQVMGDPPPRFAALIDDLSYSHVAGPGTRMSAWAVFENVGSEPWPAGDVWLGALTPMEEDTVSPFYAEDAWPAWDTAAVLAGDVAPGDTGRIDFELEIPADAAGEIVETFRLVDPEGELMNCPEPAVTVTVMVEGDRPEPVEPDAHTGVEARGLDAGCSCTLVH